MDQARHNRKACFIWAGKLSADPMLGPFAAVVDGKRCNVDYEPDPDLRDSEQVPLLEDRGIEAFIRREVPHHTPEAWVDDDAEGLPDGPLVTGGMA